MKIILSESELNVLKEAVKLNNSSVKLEVNNNEFLISDSNKEDILDELREICSDYLQIVGFDNNYNITEKGQLLENLIDKLGEKLNSNQ
jgi:hypothetical protein